jgi:hypothetical protein
MAQSQSEGVQDSVSLEIAAPSLVRSGRVIPIALRLRNRTAQPLTLQLMGRTMTFDVVVRDQSGREVFRLLKDRATAAILRLERLNASEVREMLYRWDQHTDDGRQTRPGEYTIEALLPTDAEPIRSSAVPLRILPR